MRCVGMDLESKPLHGDIKLLLQLVDNAHADVAEGSNVVGKDLHADAHGPHLVFNVHGLMLIEYGYVTRCMRYIATTLEN